MARKAFRQSYCPSCATPLSASGEPTTVDEIMFAIERLSASERSRIPAWMGAKYDVRGERRRDGYSPPPKADA
jgi:alpha-amylase/alpha-mannosidase (GH57 family)